MLLGLCCSDNVSNEKMNVKAVHQLYSANGNYCMWLGWVLRTKSLRVVLGLCVDQEGGTIKSPCDFTNRTHSSPVWCGDGWEPYTHGQAWISAQSSLRHRPIRGVGESSPGWRHRDIEWLANIPQVINGKSRPKPGLLILGSVVCPSH